MTKINKKDLIHKLNDNPFKSVTQAIYEILLDEIINFILLPETVLVESYIAESLNVSRSPVREAICLLEQDGFVRRNYKKSAVVSPLEAKDYFDLAGFRYLIEPAAAGYASLRIIDKEIKQLEDYTKQIENAYKSENYKDMLTSEDNFHEYIVLCSKHKYLIDAYKKIKSKIRKYRIYVIADKAARDFIIREHYIILDSVKFKNKDIATSACKRHIAILLGKSENEVKESSVFIQKRLKQINQY